MKQGGKAGGFAGNYFVAIRKTMVRDYYCLVERHLGVLLNSGISPNFITVAALIVSAAAACAFGTGYFLTAGCLLFAAAVFDTLDGAVARLKGRSTLYGALLDSTLDRYSEFFIFFGLLVYFRSDWIFFFIMPALLGSMMVSYIKARAESLGNIRTVGLMQRPERLTVLFFGAVLNPLSPFIREGSPDIILKTSLIVLAVMTNVTAVRRLLEGRKDLDPTQKNR
jgi:CDP-diacylglycerol--glycerol-3-phosphate 3-phosphatidyltransferase